MSAVAIGSGTMNPGLVVVVAVTAAMLLAVVVLLRDRSRLRREVDTSHAALEVLKERVDRLADEAENARMAAAAAPVVPQVDYVITTAGLPEVTARSVPDHAVLSATVGEPLVKVAAFAYGVRRALSAESRNRITFEVKREIRRARKQRRREAKQAAREAVSRNRRSEAAA